MVAEATPLPSGHGGVDSSGTKGAWMVTVEALPTDDEFRVRTEPNGDALVVRAFGRIDTVGAKSLEKELRRAFGEGASSVLLDLGNVSFIDASGLFVLLAVAKLSVTHGRRLRIVRISSPVGRVIERSGVERGLPIAA
jgi:anti-anti-sigma factor